MPRLAFCVNFSPLTNEAAIMYEELVTNIRIVKKPSRTLAFIRNVGPYMGDQALFERLFTKVIRWTRIHDLMRHDLEVISVYHDNPDSVPAGQQRISVGVTVPTGTKPDGEVQVMKLPAGDYVVGSFEIFPDEYANCWNEIMDWINRQQLEVRGNLMYECYRNDPNTHPLGKHIVDICVPVMD